MGFQLQVQCLNTFEEVIEKNSAIENLLLNKRTIKIYKNTRDNNGSNNIEKPHFWSKNNNTINDGVVYSNIVKTTQPMLSPPRPITSNNQVNSQRSTSKFLNQP